MNTRGESHSFPVRLGRIALYVSILFTFSAQAQSGSAGKSVPHTASAESVSSIPGDTGAARANPPASLLSSLPLRRDEETATLTGRGGNGILLSGTILFAALASIVWLRKKMGHDPLSGNRRSSHQKRGPLSSGKVLSTWFGNRQQEEASLFLVSSVRLTAQVSSHVLRWHDEEWLITCSQENMQVIASRPCTSATTDADQSKPATAISGAEQ